VSRLRHVSRSTIQAVSPIWFQAGAAAYAALSLISEEENGPERAGRASVNTQEQPGMVQELLFENGLPLPPYSRISWTVGSCSAETRISFWRRPCSPGGPLFSRFHRRCSGRTARQLYPSRSPSPPFGSPPCERRDSISCAPWRLRPMPFPSSSSGPTICLPSKKSCVSCPHGCPARCFGPSSSARP